MSALPTDFFRVCDCNTGRYVTSLTKSEIEYIYDLVVKHNATSGDFIASTIAEGAIEKLTDMRDYVEKSDRDQ